MEIFEILCLMLLSLTGGMYWGPWLALTRSLSNFEPSELIKITKQLSKNMSQIMTPLTPISILSILPILVLSFGNNNFKFLMSFISLLLFTLTLVVTMVIEVPIVKQIENWEVSNLPNNWKELRDRWLAFHYLRVIPSIIGLLLICVCVAI